uniref:uncharacterized protein LOC120824547 isoform X1 n=1 Tax=Gasterosteus aculeatus aculeatus TaxID=481459 RepID=UPI001A990334|nr:uncharacterized protein LOC120824547 isoform X1 [Gasterosteus aculeatus aculeatus]
MQLLCVAALVLSAVAAQPGSRRPWQDGKFPPAVADSKRGDGEQPVTRGPEDVDEGSSGDWPAWDSDHLSHVSTSGKRQVPGVTVRLRRHLSGPNRQSGRRGGPSRGQKPNRRNPVPMVFSPVFKVDNVTFQNVTDVTLKEGENIFLMPKQGPGEPQDHKRGRDGFPKNGEFVKLIYNATEPNKVSLEFGVFKLMNPRKFIGEENHSDEMY